MASDLSQCPPVIQLVKSSPDVEREYINRALRALARCIGHSAIPDPTGHAGEFLSTDGTDIFWATAGGGSGTVTSVQVSGGSTGLSFSGGPITTSGTITMSGTLDIDNGGTGQTTANAALNALLPSQTTHNGKFLQTNGTNSSWQTVTTGGQVNTVVAGPGMDVDSTDPVNPVVSAKPASPIVGGFTNGGLPLFGTTYTPAVWVPYAFTITAWHMGGDGTAGSGTIDIETSADQSSWSSITGGLPPAVSTDYSDSSSTLTGWTTSFSAGLWLRFKGSGFAAWTRSSISIEVTKP